jgi:hypothetical protein
MKYIFWGLITLAVIVVVGVVSHASAWAFIASLVIWGFGVYVQAYQMYKGGNESTNLFPYVLQALGVACMMVIQGFFAA